MNPKACPRGTKKVKGICIPKDATIGIIDGKLNRYLSEHKDRKELVEYLVDVVLSPKIKMDLLKDFETMV